MSVNSPVRGPRTRREHVIAGGMAVLVVAAVVVATIIARSATSAAPTAGELPDTTSAAAASSSTGVSAAVAPLPAPPVAAEATDTLGASSTSTETTSEPAAASPTGAATPLPAANPALVPAEPAAAPAPEPSPAPDPNVVPSARPAESLITGRQMYATGSVNVRDAPGTDGTSVIDGLSTGQQVTAGDTVDGWVPVLAGGTYGWVSADYLADGAPPAPAPVEQPVAPPAPAAAESAGNWMEALLPQVDPGRAANWVFERNGGYGATDGHTVYIDPNVPADLHYSVMVHEYSHILQVQVYGSLNASAAALSAIIGASSSDVTANESTADCMALMLGASWVDYGCQPALQDAAEAILTGQRP